MRNKLESRALDRGEPVSADQRSPEEIEQIVVLERLHSGCQARRGRSDLPCGAAALRQYLHDQSGVCPLPSVRRISRILTQYGLTYGRTGWYEGDEPDWLPASARIPLAERRRVILARRAAP